ncbi:MAG: cation:proton antiporter [Candidatus Hodarchaeota archaeon]
MIDLSILAGFGIILVLGVVGSDILKKIHFPQILGFMLVGVILNIFFTLTDHTIVITDFLDIVVALTLGFIGFNLGSEIDWKTIRTMSLRILVILLSEALLTFILVTIVIYIILGFTQFHIALIFGSLASATAPAGTAAVFWENKAKGALTTTTMFILALDDIVAILLTDLALDYSTLVYEGLIIDLPRLFLPILYDISLSIGLGVVAGLIATYFLNREDDHSEYVDFVLGAILVCIGCAAILGISYILPTMVFGVVISSITVKPDIDAPTKRIIEEVSEHIGPRLIRVLYDKRKEIMEEQPHQIFDEVYRLASPIIAMFFVLIGLSLDLSAIGQIGLIGILYMLTRTIAKYIGASLGAYISRAEIVVQRYLGPCLLSQAGVALGLAVIISEHLAKFGAEIVILNSKLSADLFILNTITATTIIFQIFGPLAIKWAIDCSGEANIDK